MLKTTKLMRKKNGVRDTTLKSFFIDIVKKDWNLKSTAQFYTLNV